MRLPTFKGGIHPPDGKSLTAEKTVEVLSPKGDLVYPLSQHLGAPCAPLVKRGDRVLLGQRIADTDAFVSAPILASVSGTVKEIGFRMTIPGSFETCVIVENDEQYIVRTGIPGWPSHIWPSGGAMIHSGPESAELYTL